MIKTTLIISGCIAFFVSFALAKSSKSQFYTDVDDTNYREFKKNNKSFVLGLCDYTDKKPCQILKVLMADLSEDLVKSDYFN